MTMRHDDIMLVRQILSSMRKTKNGGHFLKDQKDVEQVIAALHTAGYVVVPRGVINAMKKLLEKI